MAGLSLRPPLRRRPVVEELEARILYAADLLPFAHALSDAAEVRVAEVPTAAPASAVAEQATSARHEIVFVDPGVADWTRLVADLQAQQDADRQLDVVLLDAGRDGVAQITEALHGRQDIAAIHLISHGEAGAVMLGSTRLDTTSIENEAARIAAWAPALQAGADILVYGCDVAASPDGQALLARLRSLSGADIAASTDLTGAARLGGDWTLEYTLGPIQARIAADAATQADWQGVLATYTVTNTNDSGAGSFRQAILDANANPGADVIHFSIVGTGIHTISLASMLPSVTGQVNIDATTDDSFAANGSRPAIAIDGGNTIQDGLELYGGSDGSTVRGLIIERFFEDGIDISSSSNNTVAGNWIGLNTAGTGSAGNQQGVNLWSANNNTVGGTTAADRNVISGNTKHGVFVGGGSSGTHIYGNYIGTAPSGTSAIGNGEAGILLMSSGATVGGTTAAYRNIISGNLYGVGLFAGGSSNSVLGNYIGTDVTGSVALGNTSYGIQINSDASNNVIGGTAAGAGNLISGNTNYGVAIMDPGTSGNQIQGNWIGINAAGTASLSNLVGVMLVSSTTGNTIGGTTAGAGNVISGNAVDGIQVFASATGNFIQGNLIGLNPGGTAAIANANQGIALFNGATNTLIGGTTSAARNVISGNGSEGIRIQDSNSTGNTVQGNYIGTNAAGTAGIGNAVGVHLFNGTTSNTIGGTAAGAGNLIAYNSGIGVSVTDATTTGNVILSNSFTSNGGLAIDLGADGVTLNDVGDADTGPNNLTNFVDLSTATTTGSELRLSGALSAVANTYYVVQVYASSVGDPSGYGEGTTYLGAINVPVGATGSVSGRYTLSVAVAAGAVITSTATRTDSSYTTYYETSEFSNQVVALAPGITVTPVSTTTTEAGGTASFTVVLNAAPTATVTIPVSSSDTTEGTVSTASLSFTTANWNTPQTVTVTGVNDTLVDGNVAYSAVLGAASSADTAYNGVNPADVSLTNTDDDTYNTVTVTTTADTVDGATSSLAALMANMGADGKISLREALTAANNTANASGGADRIAFNIAGAGVHTISTTSALPAVTGAVVIDGSTQPGYAGSPLIVLDGSGAGSNVDGFDINSTAAGSTIRGLAIGGFSNGLYVAASNTTIQGNYLGVDATGTTALANRNGVEIVGVAGNLIGGTTAADRNVISGNDFKGVVITGAGATGNIIEGNYIGTTASGMAALANGDYGVWITSGASANTLGGTAAGAGNLISGNTTSGVVIDGANNNTVAGNLIGLAADGNTALANGEFGVGVVAGASGNLIGGPTTASRNVISGNTQYGLDIDAAIGPTANNTVQNNYLGTNAAGSAAVGNGSFGLVIDFGATNTTVLNNLISGNTAPGWSASRGGIYLYGNGATIQGNVIGLDATGTTFIGNGGGASTAGIYEAGGSTGALIGGTGAGQGNTIAGNTGPGVVVLATGNIRVLGNSIYSNSGLGIDLGNNGVTANDTGDGDSGANGLQNFPVLTSVMSNATSLLSVAGTLNSAANSYYRVEFFANTSADGSGYGEGKTYVGYVNVATNGAGNATFSTTLSAVVPVGAFLSATATKSDVSYATYTDTSEFALDVQAQSWNTAPVNTVPGAQSVNEDTALSIGGLSVADAESNLSSSRVTVNNGTLTVSLAGGASVSAGANGSASLTLSGTAAQINAALATLSYQGTANFNGADVLTVLSTDTGGLTDSDTVAITVTAVNDAPVLAGANAFTTITEDQTTSSGDLVSALISGQVTDVDSGAVSGIAVTSVVSSTGTWQYSLDNGSTWNAVGSVSGNSALLLRATDRLRFVPDGQNGMTASVTFRAWDQTSGTAGNKVDASTNGGTTAFSTATGTSSITVTSVNDAPTLAGANAFTTITEDQTTSSGDLVSALISGQVTDVDTGAVSNIAVTSVVSSTGTWQYSLDNGSTWNAVGSVSGNSALLLRATDRLRFVPDGQNGMTASVTFRAWDQTSGTAGNKVDASTNGGTTAFSTATATSSITVTSVNDAPSMPGVAFGSTAEDTTISWQVATLAGYSSDVDTGALKGLAIVGVDDSHGVWQYTLDGSSWTDIGPVSASHALLLAADATSAFRFVPAADWNGTTGMFQYEAWDQTSGTAGTYVDASATGGTSAFSGPSGSTLTVTPVNDPPVITSNGGGSTASVAVPENTTAVTTVTATDVDSPSLSFSIAGGADAAFFTVDSTTGVLRFVAAPNFEVPADANGDNQYVVTVQVSDGSLATPQTLTVAVTDVNEPPVITSNGGASSAALSVPENQVAVTVVAATDPDAGATLTYSISGGADAALFSVDPSGGVLTFNTPPSATAPTDANGDGVYLVTVSASDGTYAASQSLSISVTRDGGISVVPAIASVGAETRVNTTTVNEQVGPDSDNCNVAVDSSGNMVVVWMSQGQDGSGYGVYGQRYDGTGAAVGGEFQISQTTAGNQQFPSVVMAQNGSFVVVWTSDATTGGDIFMRRYAADGTALSGETRVNTTTTNTQHVPNVAMDGSGNFIVVWDSYASGNYDVRAQRFTSSGAAVGGEFTVNTTLSGDQRLNSVAMDASGAFVITWTGINGDGSGNGVFGQRYNAAGTAQGSQFQINQTTANNQDWAHVAMDGSGGFVVVWQSAANDAGDVYARRYDASGFAVTNEFRVNVTTAGQQSQPAVVMDAHGNFIVAWTSAGQDGSGNGVYARRFSAGGVALGGEFLVNVTTVGGQAFPHIAQEADGDFVIEWEGAGPGDADGVFLRRYSVQGLTTEAGGTASFQVVLDRAPTASVTIAVSSSNPAAGTVSTSSLVFTSANWNTPQTVTVTGVDNAVANLDVSYTIQLGAAVSSDTVYGGIDPNDVLLTNHNDDLTVTTASDVVDGDTSSLNALIANPGADGRVSLREAITAANNTTGTDTLRFNIPEALVGGAHTIAVATDLPTLSDAAIIDGSSEPDFAGTPLVVLDGSNSASRGLEIGASGSTVRGLVIERFTSRGILVDGGVTNTVIAGNYIGTDVTGLLARGNGSWGIDLLGAGSGTRIGGTTSADRNVIGANLGWGGIAINGAASTLVTGNYIGVGADGVTALGNGMGVYVLNATTGSRIGGTAAGEGNLIGYNTTGIALQTAGAQAAILGNRYVGNTGQAIDLGWDGVAQANDTNDPDTGPNALQNNPVFSLARSDGSSQVSITGTFNTLANGYYRVEFYATPINGGASGAGETLRYLGYVNVPTDGSGNAAGTFSFSSGVGVGEYVTATATRSNAAYSVFYETSELARNVAVLSTFQASVVVDTTADTLDGDVTSLSTLLANKGADGRVSLREALLAANATSNGSGGADQVLFSIPDARVGGVHTIALGTALPTVTDAALIDATSEPDYVGTPVVVLDGSAAGSSADGLAISAGSSVVKGLTIQNFGHYGIYLTGGGGNQISGNYIGTTADGTAAAANHWGIVVDNAAGNVIGGTTAAARNLISGNLNDGINLSGSGATGNLVEGNYIGTNATGTAAVGNGGVGIALGAGASSNTVGGATAATRNLISGNTEYGVFVTDPSTTGNLIQGNWIGLDVTGTSALGNGGFGVVVDGLAANTSLLGNVISGNTAAGWSASRGGIYLYANGVTVQGNRIGTDASGNALIANGGGTGMSGGIVGREASVSVLIGGTQPGEANVIAGNTGDGVVIEGQATGYTVLGNSIHDNSGLGIDLGHDGVTANDAGDADLGLQNFPTLFSAQSWGGNTVISGELRSQANSTYRVEFFANPAGGADPSGFGEGLTYLGFLDVTTDATGYAALSTTLAGVSVAVGSRISATATGKSGASSYGATSEFGADLAVTPAGAVNVSAISGATSEAGGTATFTVVLTIQPTADVTVALAVSDATEGSLSVGSLTFTSANWATPQTVTVTGVDDSWVDGNVSYTIVTGAAASADTNYDGVAVADLTVLNTDNDTYNTLVVDTAADTADGDTSSIGALIASKGADGHISLREALLAANATANGSGGPDRIVFNIAGTGTHTLSLTSALPAITGALVLDGSAQPGYAGTPLIELDGSGAGSSDGLVLAAGSDGSTITGLAVDRFAGIGIEVASSGNTLRDDYLGLRPDGVTAAGNGSDGLRIDNVASNTVSHVVASGNQGAGIAVIGASATGNTIVASRVGLNAAGSAVVGNGLDGIALSAGAHHNVIGSATGGQGNVVSGNTGAGIGLYATHDNQILGNLIGLDATGTAALGNGQSGIAASQTSGERVGGSGAGAGNTISGNGQNGLSLVDASGTVVQGNRIGLAATGATPLGNAGAGIALSGNTTGSLIGGTAAAEANRIAGNQIGVVIGGTSTGNAILGNSVFNNALLGIDLGWDGVTANDTGDGDAGPNDQQNFPVLTYANSSGGNTTITGTFNTAAHLTVRLEFFASTSGDASGYGEGQTYLGFTTVTTDAQGNASFNAILSGVSLAAGVSVSATATVDAGGGSFGSTSEFAANLSVTNAGPGITVTPTSGLQTSELGGSASFTVVLDSAPVADVVIALSVSDATEGSLSVPSLTFTPTNWNQTQTVTVTGVADGIVDGNVAYTVITTAASSADAGYNALDAADVAVTNFDANPPAITSDGGGATASINVAENTTAVTTVTATDPDVPAQTLTYSLAGGADAARFSIDANTGVLSFLTAPDYELPVDSNGDNLYDLIVQVSDGSFTASQTLAIHVTPVNDNAPAIASNGGGASASINVAENTTAVTTVTATDADLPAQTLTYSLAGGADVARFSIDANTGVLSFLTAPDYELPVDSNGDNLYDLIVQVSDGSFTASQALAIHVTPVNDNAPAITSNGGGATASINVAENTTAVTTVTATDADLPAQTLTYSLAGGADAARFSIDANTGVLSFLTAPDYELPVDSNSDNLYDLIVQVSDGSFTASQTLAIHVTPVNDNAPQITSNGGGASASINIAENTTAVTTVTATDADLPAQTLTYSLAGGADVARFSIDANTGVLTFLTAPDYELPVGANGDNTYDLIVQVSDGGFTAIQALAIHVTPVNDNAPAITSDGGGATASINVAENVAAVTTVTATDADLPAQTLTYSLAGGADVARFSIDANTGVLSFLTAPDYELPTDANGDNTYDLIVQVSDGGLTASQTLAIHVTPVNDNAPAITSDGGGATASINVAENTAAVTTVTATDPDVPAQTLTYSLAGGADAARFSIDANTGVLTFITAPDYEAPTDANGDNTYDLIVQVSDGSFTASQTLAIHVTPVNDNAPAIASNGGGASASINVAENTTAVTTVTATDADLPAQTLTYSLAGGADVARFSIDANTGVLSFLTAPDYELPVDANGDNTYDLIVQVSDGGFTASQTLAIHVTPVNDNAPAITSNGGGATASINVAENTTAVTTVTATDADLPAQTLTYSLAGGADVARFSIDANTGALTFLSAPDYELPTDANGDNTYDLIVQVSDGGFTASQTLAIHVTPVNDNAPAITSNGGGASASINVAENVAAVTTVTATDADLPAPTLTYSLAGGSDVARFSIDANTGVLTFLSAPDYELPVDSNGDNLYDLIVQVSDGSFTASQALAIHVTPVNDNAPAITSNGGGATASINVAENTTAVTTVTATDADLPAQTLTYSLAGGADVARFSIDANTGVLTFLTAPDYELPTDVNGDNTYDLIVQVSDGQRVGTQALAIHVTNVNEAPVAVADAYAGNEDTAITGSVLDNDTDVEGDRLTARLVSGPAHGTLALGADGHFTYTPDANYNGADSFRYVAHDGALDSAITLVSLSVAPVNDAPVTGIVTLAPHPEDGGPRLITQAELLAAASDVDGDPLVARNLVIAAGRGTLTDQGDGTWTFVPAPDDDAQVTFSFVVSDGQATTPARAVLTLIPVNDAPTAASAAFATPDTQPHVGQLPAAHDVEGDPVVYGLASAPSRGTVVVQPDGHFTYTPIPGNGGTDTFTFSVTDNHGAATTHPVTVVITVAGGGPGAEGGSNAAGDTGDGTFNGGRKTRDASAGTVKTTTVPRTPQTDAGTHPVGRVEAAVLRGAQDDGGQDTVVASTSVVSSTSLHHAFRRTGNADADWENVRFSWFSSYSLDFRHSRAGAVQDWTPASGHPGERDDGETLLETLPAKVAGVSLSVGVVWWAARAGGLLASLAASLPAWRGVDMLMVLKDREPDDDDEADDAHTGGGLPEAAGQDERIDG